MSTSTALPRLHRAGLASIAGTVLALTTLAAVNAAFAGTSAERGERPARLASHDHATPRHPTHPRAHTRPRVAPAAPVGVRGDDWRCDAPADEKFICSLGEASVVVTWRRAAEHDEYLGIAKGGGTIFVSDVHGPFFATVMGGPETPQSQVDQVGALLAWR